MRRFLIFLGLCAFLVSGIPIEAGGKKSKIKPLPDHYKQFKLGMSRKLVERKVTPVYTHDPSPGLKLMALNVGGKEVHAILLVLWQEKLASIVLVFQEGHTLEKIKANLVKKYGEPSKDDPMETIWIDSERVMGLKFEYNIMDLRDRVTVAYTDIAAYQEIQEAGTRGPRRLRRPREGRGKRDVPPQ